MQEACNAIGCCDVGSVVLTDGFALPAKYVIHTVGPQYSKDNTEKLTICWVDAMRLPLA